MKDGTLRIQWIRSVDIGVNFALSDNDWRIRTWRGIPLFLHHGNVPKSPVGIIDCNRGLRLFGFLPPDSKSVTDRGWLGTRFVRRYSRGDSSRRHFPLVLRPSFQHNRIHYDLRVTIKRNIDWRCIHSDIPHRHASFWPRYIEGFRGRNNHRYRGIPIRKPASN